MDSVVLVKAVPRSEALRYDPERGRMVRDGAELVLNPFDQRAVRVALELRRPGETVTVVSLGPREALPVVRETRALGVDRVVLLSDPVFAGSDTLVTSRALARALSERPHDLVLGGSWTTDSETGQVGPEVAELLDMDLIANARAVRRDPEGNRFEVTVDTSVGWATYRARLPLVITVGEKIAKPLHATPEAIAAIVEPAVEVRTAASIGLDRGLVGVAGSPTVVGRVLPVESSRKPQVFDTGPVVERVRHAVAALAPLLGAPRPSPGPLPPPPPDRSPSREVLVVVTGLAGDLEPQSLGFVSEVRRALPGYWPSAVWTGGPPTEAATYRLDLAGALGGYCFPSDPGGVDARAVAANLGSLVDQHPSVAAVLVQSDPFGREAAGRLAAQRSLGLVGDATAMRTDPTKRIVWSKPSFGGRAVAEVFSKTRPAIATLRPGTFAPAPTGRRGDGFGWRSLKGARRTSAVALTAQGTEGPETFDLERREVIVAVGLGVGGPEGVEQLRPTLARWNAGLVATRRVVDAGWVPRTRQLGLTGRSLAPRLAVLLGVSGSANHMVGWRRAGALLAVNRDPEAAVFREVDVGIVGEVDETVSHLTEALAALLGR
jgi:electron transfer flavoprotein alpha subunit